VKKKDLTEMVLVDLLMYADDMVLLDDDIQRLKQILLELDEELHQAGMTMNVKKTKILVLNDELKESIVVRGEPVEEERAFPYLGFLMTTDDAYPQDEITNRISKASRVFNSLHLQSWQRKEISTLTKSAIYRGAVLPVLMYGSEAWVIPKTQLSRLEVFNMKCLRIILAITKYDHRTNESVLSDTQQLTIEERIRQSRLRWLGHVKRMSPYRLPLKLLYGTRREEVGQKVDGKI
jgi:hypothetical protein